MTIYYVDTDINASSPGGLSWADPFDSIKDAIDSTLIGSGDEVWVASGHSYSYPDLGNVTLTFPDGSIWISVNKTTDEYEAGAEESIGYSDNLTLTSSVPTITPSVIGISFSSSDLLSICSEDDSINVSDCVLGQVVSSDSDYITVSSVNASSIMKDVEFKLQNNQEIRIIGHFRADNISFDSGYTFDNPPIFFGGADSTSDVIIKNSDFSGVSGTTSSLCIMTSFCDNAHASIIRCKTPSGLALMSGTLGQNHEVNFESVDNGDGYHYFEYHRYTGVALESTTVKRTGGATYDGTNGFSTEFQPNSNVVAYTQPLRIKIAELELNLTSANILTFHLAFGDDSVAITPFNNDEAWIEIEQNSDALTSKALGITINTKPDDILTTPTQLIASTEAFTSNATTLELDYVYSDKRQIAIDTVAVSGMTNGQVTAYLCIAKHVSTLQIFGCPSPVVT